MLLALGAGLPAPASATELLNVSYDPTRELYRDLNAAFAEDWGTRTGQALTIRQSHGGSGTQARAVVDGLEADVVTLAVPTDTDQIAKAGLLAPGWRGRLPNDSLPFLSTIVFVVRKGNPKAIHDWPDLVRPGVTVITPSPKTSGNGKLSFLAAWGAVKARGGSDDDALAYVKALYAAVPVLDLAARNSTVTFVHKKMGDVHLSWENEAHLEVAESKGAVEIVYPPLSIRAEPAVAWVDANVERNGTRAAAEAYLRFLYTPAAQEIAARHHYRPTDPEVAKRVADTFPAITLFPVTDVAADWQAAQDRFFGDGGVFDGFYRR